VVIGSYQWTHFTGTTVPHPPGTALALGCQPVSARWYQPFAGTIWLEIRAWYASGL